MTDLVEELESMLSEDIDKQRAVMKEMVEKDPLCTHERVKIDYAERLLSHIKMLKHRNNLPNCS